MSMGLSSSPLGAEVGNAKEHLLRRIEELRREVAYDYPPIRIAERIRDVQQAKRGYEGAWDEAAKRYHADHREAANR